MATYIGTKDSRILIDPSVSLAPPHPLEKKRISECAEIIVKCAEAADILTVSYYHNRKIEMLEAKRRELYGKGKVERAA